MRISNWLIKILCISLILYSCSQVENEESSDREDIEEIVEEIVDEEIDDEEMAEEIIDAVVDEMMEEEIDDEEMIEDMTEEVVDEIMEEMEEGEEDVDEEMIDEIVDEVVDEMMDEEEEEEMAEEDGEEEDATEEEVTDEGAPVSGGTEEETTDGTEACDCTIKPAEDANFTGAMEDSKLQSDFLPSDNKDLVNFCDPEFFYYCDGKLVMKASGVKDERTELRQEKSLALNDYSDMEFEATFNKVPATSTTKGITIAQIHNDFEEVGRPLIRVDIINGDKVQSHIQKSYVKNDGSASNDDLVAFAEGDLLYTKLEISAEGNEVKVFVENRTQGLTGEISYIVDNQWDLANGEYYYKAGIYSQEAQPEDNSSIAYFNFITYHY